MLEIRKIFLNTLKDISSIFVAPVTDNLIG